MQTLIKLFTMQFKSYEHFQKTTSICRNGAQGSLVTDLHTFGLPMLQCTINKCKIWSKYIIWFKCSGHFYELTMTGWTDVQQSLVDQKGCYACQWLDNAGMHTLRMQNMIKIYFVDEELWGRPLSANRRTVGQAHASNHCDTCGS